MGIMCFYLILCLYIHNIVGRFNNFTFIYFRVGNMILLDPNYKVLPESQNMSSGKAHPEEYSATIHEDLLQNRFPP